MLDSVSKRTALCYWRAAECRELAALSISATDRQIYLEREQAWLTLARSYEFSERNGRMHQEAQRQRGRSCSPRALPKCPFCSVEMQFHASQPDSSIAVQVTVLFERIFFLCPNCRSLSDQLVAMVKDQRLIIAETG
jgi:hypothetical protein